MNNYPTAEEKRAQNENFDELIDKIFTTIENEKWLNYVTFYSYNSLPKHVIEFFKNKGYEIIHEDSLSISHFHYKISW